MFLKIFCPYGNGSCVMVLDSDREKEPGFGLPDFVEQISRASVRDIIALYKADSLYGEKRTEVEAQIKEKIRDRLSEYFELNAVFIRRVTLPQNLKTTIEQKLQAQQEAQKMEYVVQREKLEADRKSIEAKGIATFNELIAKSINDKYLQWYYIQALDKIGNNPNSKVVLLPSSLNNAASSTPSIILNTN